MDASEIINKKNREFITACEKGNLPQVRLLLCPDRAGYKAQIDYNVHQGLRRACEGGHLDIAAYLLASPEVLLHQGKHANIHADDDYALKEACFNGHTAVAKYLLGSPDLKEHANLAATHYQAFTYACSQPKAELVKFLVECLHSETTSSFAEKEQVFIQGFKEACAEGHVDCAKAILHETAIKQHEEFSLHAFRAFRRAYANKREQVMHFLALEECIDIHESLAQFLIEKPEVAHFFRSREMYKEMHLKLPLKAEDNKKRLKI